jgi:hypothetical protein
MRERSLSDSSISPLCQSATMVRTLATIQEHQLGRDGRIKRGCHFDSCRSAAEACQTAPVMERSDIGRKVRLFNRSYALAWERVSDAMKTRKPDIKEALAAGIRKQISLGVQNPAAIAADALDELLSGMRSGQ